MAITFGVVLGKLHAKSDKQAAILHGVSIIR